MRKWEGAELKYFNFSGVASRQQYWAVLVIAFVIGMIGSLPLLFFASLGTAAFIIASLAFFVILTWCVLATSVRRSRDAGISPWWALLYFIPYANVVLIIVAGVLKTKSSDSSIVADASSTAGSE